MFRPQLRITRIDHYGFTGRENHPSDSDVGLTVTPINSWAEHIDNEEGFMQRLVDDDDHSGLAVALLDREPGSDLVASENAIWFYTCVTEDGRILDMVDFEVEEVRHPVPPKPLANR